MKKRVVRFVLPDGVHNLTEKIRNFIYTLREGKMVLIHRDEPDGICFDLIPSPEIENTVEWAQNFSNLFQSHHFNAVEAFDTR